jgi:hypothetical protein
LKVKSNAGSPKTQQSLNHWGLYSDLNLFAATPLGVGRPPGIPMSEEHVGLDGRRAGDLIAFGRDYIANPDLADRVRLGASLNAPRPEFFYGNSATGYTDYPALPLTSFNVRARD